MATAETGKRKHPNLASWLATFASPTPGETHGHGGEHLHAAPGGAANGPGGEGSPAAAAAATVPPPTLRDATKDTASWLDHHQTPVEESGEAARDPRIPVFTLRPGARRHAAFVCPSHADGWAVHGPDGRPVDPACATPAADAPGECNDTSCYNHGGATVPVHAFYRCPGSCRGAVLAPSLCYPIAASICEREDEPIFAVVGCGACERAIASERSGALALCGKVCTACRPVYRAAKLPGLRELAVGLTERCGTGSADSRAAAAEPASIETESDAADEPPAKRAAAAAR